nr:glycosyltransferase [Chthonobacter albigriseus]
MRAHEAVAERLTAAGHRATLVGIPDMGELVRLPSLRFIPVGSDHYPPGAQEAAVRRAASPDTPWGLLGVVHEMRRQTDMLCARLPAVMRGLGPDIVVADQMEAAGALVADHLGIPWISLASALPVERDPAVPLPVLPFDYDPSPRGLARNRFAARIHDALMGDLHRAIRRQSSRLGLRPRCTLADCVSPLATVSQTVAAFEFPRARPERRLRHVGPLRPMDDSEPPVRLPWDDDSPVVFVSLGTLQGHRAGIFRAVAEACRRIGARSVVAHCGGLDALAAADIGADLITDFVPQRAMLRQASAVVTHAGTNTVFDALAAGVPVLAIPIAFDQPGAAARIVHHGVGLRLSKRRLKVDAVADALTRLIDEPTFRDQARSFAPEVAAAGGAARAAEIVLHFANPQHRSVPEAEVTL